MLISNCTIDWKEHVFNVSMSHLILRMCVCVCVNEVRKENRFGPCRCHCVKFGSLEWDYVLPRVVEGLGG